MGFRGHLRTLAGVEWDPGRDLLVEGQVVIEIKTFAHQLTMMKLPSYGIILRQWITGRVVVQFWKK